MATKKSLVNEASKAINENKLQKLVLTKVSKALTEEKKTPKAKAEKKSKEEPKLEIVPENVKVKAAKAKKEKVVKEVTEINKTNLIEKVVSNREVKYIYPDDCTDTLSRKSWRQKVRNRLHSLEMAMYRIKDQSSKEFKAAMAEYTAYKNSISKANTAV
ncbi:MAG: hypothetical protein RSC49_08245 [Clostridium sp.]